MADIFISYKSEEYKEANRLKELLAEQGISCWIAPASMRGGSNYAAEIPKAIKKCKVFVLLLTEKAQNSRWVPKELGQAIGEGKKVFPFMLENFTLREDFDFLLKNVQYYRAFEDREKMEKNLARDVCEYLGIEYTEKKDLPSEEKNKPETEHSFAEKTGETLLKSKKQKKQHVARIK